MELLPDDEKFVYASQKNLFAITEIDGVEKMYPPGFSPEVPNVFARFKKEGNESFEEWFERIKKIKTTEAQSRIKKARKEIERSERVLKSFQTPGS